MTDGDISLVYNCTSDCLEAVLVYLPQKVALNFSDIYVRQSHCLELIIRQSAWLELSTAAQMDVRLIVDSFIAGWEARDKHGQA